jgi:pyruvate,water dikinase
MVRRVLCTTGPVIGPSRTSTIHEIVYVVPDAYCQLPWCERRAVARAVGEVVHARRARAEVAILLIGPGRWGTGTPELGVPVTFADIDRVSVLCECFSPCGAPVPDPSLGCHFLGGLVEREILYLGVHLDRDGHSLDQDFLRAAPNALPSLIGDSSRWDRVVRVVVPPEQGQSFFLEADAKAQRAVCALAD